MTGLCDKIEDLAQEQAKWHIDWCLKKFYDAENLEDTLDQEPDEVHLHSGNLLAYGGASCLWEALTGNCTATAGQALTYFNNAQAAIGVGDSTTAAAATQTDLQASSNKVRSGMVATYPTHTDATTSVAAPITFQSSFGSGVANFSWQECGIFNSASAGTGRMLNRLVQSFGVKSGGTWTLTVTVTLS